MKNRYWLFRRNGVFYIEDAQTRRKESLHTRDPHEARTLRDARNAAADCPALGLALAKAYLSTWDRSIGDRTWQDVIEQFCARGKPQTQADRRRVAKGKPFDLLRGRKLLETTANDFLEVLQAGGTMTNAFLRCLDNLAQGLGWLPWPILPSRLWPKPQVKPKRGVTEEEHGRILAAEKNPERRLYYELLWETGASQSDGASFTAEQIDWTTRTLSYSRMKTGEAAQMIIGRSFEAVLRQLPVRGILFPTIGPSGNNARAAEFHRRCRLLGIKGVSLHSYRYAWAERAKSCGYPERFAQLALGHNSAAVHRAYAKNARVTLPPLEEYEREFAQKVVPLEFKKTRAS